MDAAKRKPWVIVTLLFFAIALNQLDKLVLGLAAVPMMRELDISPAEYGLIASAFYSLFAVSGILVGLGVVNRVSSKWLLLVLVIIWSLAQLPIVFTASVAVIAICRVVLGIGEGPGSPTCYHVCYEWFEPNKRNFPTAIIIQGGTLGLLVAGFGLTWVIAEFGWRAAFLASSLIGVVWVLAWWRWGEEGPLSARKIAPESVKVAQLPPLGFWTDRTILSAVFVGFCSYWVVGLLVSWFPAYLQLNLGFDGKTAGLLLTVVAAAKVPIHLGTVWLSQRLINRGWSSRVARSIINGVALLLAATAMFVAMGAADVQTKVVLLAVGLALPSLSLVLMPQIIAQAAPAVYRGPGLVVTQSIITVAGLVATYTAGRLIDAFGTIGYDYTFYLTAAVVLVGGLVAVTLIDPEKSAAKLEALQSRSIARRAQPVTQ